MSEQPQHPANIVQAWNELVPILNWVINDSVGLPGRQTRVVGQNAQVLDVYLKGGQPADNGKQPAEAANPAPRGERQQRRREQRVADKETPNPAPAPE